MESNKGLLRCKIVVVGDAQCGKTALLHVFAKDSYPEVRGHFPIRVLTTTQVTSLIITMTSLIKLKNLFI